MNTKIISIFTLVAFIIFTISCYTTKKVDIKEAIDDTRAGKKLDIVGVLLSSGVRIDFPEEHPARIIKNVIVSTDPAAEKFVKLEIPLTSIKKRESDLSGKYMEVSVKDGSTYRVVKDSYREREDKAIFVALLEESIANIPLSEVELVWVRQLEGGKTFAAVIGGSVLALLGLGLIALATKESCPFVYSFDGEGYVFDAEPYGGAVCEGMKRTEWCGLEYLKDYGGQYKILITNEVDETQYTDEVKLLVVDHPQGTQMIPDELGKMHVVSNPVPPKYAYDGKGRSLMFLVGENDWVFWTTKTTEKSVENKEDLKDELVFEFPKPDGATEAKLLFNGCNTIWGSQMVKRFLELQGTEIEKWYANMNAKRATKKMMNNWIEREEIYRLQIRVETKEGWTSKGTIVGGGPFVSEDRIYTIDVSDVPSDTLRIKLTPPATFWQINYLAVDYSEELPVNVRELSPMEAVDDKNQDVRAILTHTDGNYLVMPEIGDSAWVAFEAVPETAGMDRSYILKASGYYEIHLDAKGDRRTDIITRINNEPGYTIQYALQEYFKWQEENAKRASLR